MEKCPDLRYGVHHFSTRVVASSHIPRVCRRHPYPVHTPAAFNSLLLILFRLRRYVPGRDSLPMGCSGSPRSGIGGVLDPFAHFSCHTCGSPFRIFSSDTPSACGKLLFVPFISLEPLFLLAKCFEDLDQRRMGRPVTRTWSTDCLLREGSSREEIGKWQKTNQYHGRGGEGRLLQVEESGSSWNKLPNETNWPYSKYGVPWT